MENPENSDSCEAPNSTNVFDDEVHFIFQLQTLFIFSKSKEVKDILYEIMVLSRCLFGVIIASFCASCAANGLQIKFAD